MGALLPTALLFSTSADAANPPRRGSNPQPSDRQSTAVNPQDVSQVNLVNPGTSMSTLLSRCSRDSFTGIPNIYSASPGSGAPLDYVRAGASHHGEVELPQPHELQSGLVFPPIVTYWSCLPMSPDPVYLHFILPLRSFARLRPRKKQGRGRAKDWPVTPRLATD